MIEIPKLTQKIDYKDQILTPIQIDGLLQNEKNLVDAETIIESSKIHDVSWEYAESVYYSFDKEIRDKIRKSGQQLEQGYYNPNTQQLDSPGVFATDARGIMVVQIWINQNFSCAYTMDGPYHIMDFQVEHIDSSGGDYPNNIVLLLANVNENRKTSTLPNFVARNLERYWTGEYTVWYNSMKEAVKKNHQKKIVVLSLEPDELQEAWKNNKTRNLDKYFWRNIGMSSLSMFRIKKKTGEKRAGGSQGNYKAILNTILQEYIYGDKELAQEIYKCARMFRDKYLNGRIQNNVYAHLTADVVELSNHLWVSYNREQFIQSLIRNNYTWPHLN